VNPVAAALSLVLVGVMAPALATGRPVSFTAADGTQLAGMLYEAAQRPAPAVVLVHMLGRSKDEWAWTGEQMQLGGVTALAIDLRGHGRSGGNGAELEKMVGDVQGAIRFLSTLTSVRPGGIGIVGASLGANLAALAAADAPAVRVLALISPSLDYRGVRLDPAAMRKLSDRQVYVVASSQDPLAMRTLNELAAAIPAIEQRLSSVRAHGTPLLVADSEAGRALVDWLRRTLIF
jgi:alpha-beta hydrolase superfamily lysophospholipase